ncbi:glycerate kinase type-2 family protein [Marinitoga litoralis]|uniref:glycerate kinase type-2 family protein n=1 Tax=Marinitoga litoralis TaxID=570855 RepID=UPI001EF91BE7|nr:glycerate kinase [Marinitoga litoralis]MBM7560185.1 hydroxypyruvate reductase [Marinitoga litoralis]
MTILKEDLMNIINFSINSVLPENSVKEYIKKLKITNEKIFLISIGKAAWRMAKAANDEIKNNIKGGVVITKYNHSLGDIDDLEIYEAGHPIPDENSIKATKRTLELISNLEDDYTILFLISGGGSALFEMPEDGITLKDIQEITDKLLKSGAEITEINAIRKRLSKVKGGKFAKLAYPKKIYSLVLSDVLGDRLDSIASGPTFKDDFSTEQVIKLLKKYNVDVSEKIESIITKETPKEIVNAEHYIIGSVKIACDNAIKKAKELGYNTLFLTSFLNSEAKEAGKFFASIAKEIINSNNPVPKPCAIVAGGETVVNVKGHGLGGRNQELSYSFALEIEGLKTIVFASVGTDGTDGPTDAAGGIVDGFTSLKLKEKGLDPYIFLENNDSYNGLEEAGSLLKLGPTGTNVNDIIILLVGNDN